MAMDRQPSERDTRSTVTNKERNRIMEMALGRIFLLGSRPTQPGDIEQYEKARHALLTAYDEAPFEVERDYSPNWAKERLNGAQGD
jgi:hypothetical protein